MCFSLPGCSSGQGCTFIICFTYFKHPWSLDHGILGREMQGESEEIAPVWRRINSFLNSTLFVAWLQEKTLNVPLNNNCTCIHLPPWLSSKREHRHQWGYFRKYNCWQPISWGVPTWVELRTSKVMNYSNWGSKPGRESECVCVCVCVCACTDQVVGNGFNID